MTIKTSMKDIHRAIFHHATKILHKELYFLILPTMNLLDEAVSYNCGHSSWSPTKNRFCD